MRALLPAWYLRAVHTLPYCLIGRLDETIVEGRSAHLLQLYGSLVDCLSCGDRAVIEAIQKLLRRVGDELGFAPGVVE